MSRRASPSTSRACGILRVARLWGISRATLYRHRPCEQPGSRRRPGPVGPMPDEALVEAVRELLAASPFHGEGHRKIWARLRFAGVRTSKRRVLRLMRAHDLLAPNRVGRPHGPKAHDGTIRTERVDAMWGTDLTSTLTGEGKRRSSSRSITARRNASASTPRAGRPVSRRSSHCAKVCAPPSAASPRASLAA
jgi:putative transposase